MDGVQRRTLVVANLTSQTPILLQEIDRRAAAQPTAFTLLVPNTAKQAPGWTLDEGVRALRTAAMGPQGMRPAQVDGIAGGTDPFEAVKQALESRHFDDVLISTLPERLSEWLRRDLPRRVETLGVPVAVMTPPDPKRDKVISFLLPKRPDGRDD
jgi:hypothetical protein